MEAKNILILSIITNTYTKALGEISHKTHFLTVNWRLFEIFIRVPSATGCMEIFSSLPFFTIFNISVLPEVTVLFCFTIAVGARSFLLSNPMTNTAWKIIARLFCLLKSSSRSDLWFYVLDRHQLYAFLCFCHSITGAYMVGLCRCLQNKLWNACAALLGKFHSQCITVPRIYQCVTWTFHLLPQHTLYVTDTYTIQEFFCTSY